MYGLFTPCAGAARGFNAYKKERFQYLEKLTLSFTCDKYVEFLSFYSERFLTCLKISHRFLMKIGQVSIFRHVNRKNLFKIYKML